MQTRAILLAAWLGIAATAAAAHPHQWVDVASEVLFDSQGRVAAIRHHWRFDEAFTAFATQGLDSDGDGALSPEELEPLAEENVESLGEFDFFTFVSAGEYQVGFGAPKDYWLDLDENRLTLHFTLPLAQPLFTKGEILLQVYDPSYYIAMVLPSREAVRLVDAPASCRLHVHPAAGPDADAAAALATVGPEQRDLPADMQALTGGIDNSAEIQCGGPTVAAAKPGSAENASEAARLMAQGGEGSDALLSAEAAPPAGWMARLAAIQAAFNRDLTQALSGLKADGSAFWWLAGISFLYGIVHAAGPGHGKVVIASYLLANEARLKRGVLIAFLAALVQALVAVGLVALLAALLDMTGAAMTDTANLLEAGSFGLVAALGAYLLIRKGRQAFAAMHGPAHTQAGHPADCGCGHHADPAIAQKPGLAGAAAAVLSVGIRPCTGALVVLVFALAQGIFWAGIASTFLMALGTAITVAALAAFAVGAKNLAGRLALAGDGRPAHIMLGLEILAALFITALGGVLFAGALAA